MSAQLTTIMGRTEIPRIGGKSPEGAVATAISAAIPPETESHFLFLSEGIVTMVVVGGGVGEKRLKVERREKKPEPMSMQLSRTGAIVYLRFPAVLCFTHFVHSV